MNILNLNNTILQAKEYAIDLNATKLLKLYHYCIVNNLAPKHLIDYNKIKRSATTGK